MRLVTVIECYYILSIRTIFNMMNIPSDNMLMMDDGLTESVRIDTL